MEKGTVKKSIFSAILIGFGVYVLLLQNIIGAFLFAFGLLTICTLGLCLFTGMCGYVIERKNYQQLAVVLLVNLVAGYLFGLAAGFCNDAVLEAAITRVAGWEMSISFFIKSILCGIIMFCAVETYKRGTSLGIILGIPLFILCGFQHCIANIIVMGIARSFHASIIICIIGNFIGGILGWYLAKDIKIGQDKGKQ